jgi:hypothetical protein
MEAADLAEQEPETLRKMTALLVEKYRDVRVARPVWKVSANAI